MQLTLSKPIPSPLSQHLVFVHVLEKHGAFLLSDRDRVVLLRTDGSMELIANLDGEKYQWGGIGVGFWQEVVQQRLNGFKHLSISEQNDLKASTVYQSSRDLPQVEHGHEGAILFFAGKSIALLHYENDHFTETKRIRSKGDYPTARALAPDRNLLLYGTNYGELYSQTFDRQQFIKSSKIDVLPKVVYQIVFSGDLHRLFVAGLGYVKTYRREGEKFVPESLVATPARSLILLDDFLVLNKGMHGIDLIRIAEKPEKIASLDCPFTVSKMQYLAAQRTFLLCGNDPDVWAFMKISD